MRYPRQLLALAVCGLVAGGCGGDDRVSATERGSGGPLVVFAASSLTEPFEELGRAFEAEHTGVTVSFNFAASSALARQILEGVGADVIATADDVTMAAVVDAGKATEPRVVARNRLAILVEKANPKNLRALADLAGPGIVLVLCAPEVPCGRLAAVAFRAAGVTPEPASLEENVKAVVAKVTLGEADAGIVYRSDVHAVGDKAEGVDVDAAAAVEAVYPMAVTTTTANRATARAWVDFVLAARGQRVLEASGFLPS